MKNIPARLEKLERVIMDKDDDVCMVFIPTGDKDKDEEKLKRLREIAEMTASPIIVMDI